MGADSTRAPDGATTLTTKDDADILAAWEAYRNAYASCKAVLDVGPYVDGYNAAQREQIEVMERAETLINAAVPTTMRGIEVQLWAMLAHREVSGIGEEAAVAESLEGCSEHFEWLDMFALNSIRAIRAMIAKEGGAK